MFTPSLPLMSAPPKPAISSAPPPLAPFSLSASLLALPCSLDLSLDFQSPALPWAFVLSVLWASSCHRLLRGSSRHQVLPSICSAVVDCFSGCSAMIVSNPVCSTLVTLLLVSASDITPTERWLNVWCMWHTKVETLQECRSRRWIGWILQDFQETHVLHSLMFRLETKMRWCHTPSRKKKAVVFTTVTTSQGRRTSTIIMWMFFFFFFGKLCKWCSRIWKSILSRRGQSLTLNWCCSTECTNQTVSWYIHKIKNYTDMRTCSLSVNQMRMSFVTTATAECSFRIILC